MANYPNFVGFYVPVGSKDYPMSWSPEDPFGFNTVEDTIPVYASSINDVINVFKSPITNVRHFNTNVSSSANYISQLTIDKPTNTFKFSDDATMWNIVMKILDYVFFNQATITVENFNNSGILTPEEMALLTTQLTLVKTIPTRVERVSFTINSGTVGAPSPVECLVYFNPDTFISTNSMERYKVFLYEDATGDDWIDNDEWKNKIIDKHVSMFSDGRYKYAHMFLTRFVPTEGDFGYNRVFFVYSIVPDNIFNINSQQSAVKEFILGNIAGNVPDIVYNIDEAIIHYPDLFAIVGVNVHPMDTRKDSNSLYTSIVSNKTINTTLYRGVIVNGKVEREYESLNDNFKNSEVILVGHQGETTLNLPPLLCVSNNDDDTIKPISSSIPRHIPVYTTFDGNLDVYTGASIDEVKAAKVFHHLMLTAIKRTVFGIHTAAEDTIIAYQTNKFMYVVYKTSGTNNVERVQFKFLSKTYNVYPTTALI